MWPFKLLWAIVKDFFSRGYSYHASAVAFSAFLTLNASVVFLGTILKYIPNRELLERKIFEIFPNISRDVVNTIMSSLERLSVETQIVTLLLVIFFIGNFLRTLEIAFAYVAQTKPRTIPWINYLFPILFGFLILFYGFCDILLGIALKFLGKLGIAHTLAVKLLLSLKLLVDYLIFPIGLWVVYLLISPVRLGVRVTFWVSFVLSLLINPLKEVFGWYATHFLLKNLVLTPFAGILVFLIWIYTLSLLLLLGYRVILFFVGFKGEGNLSGKHNLHRSGNQSF